MSAPAMHSLADVAAQMDLTRDMKDPVGYLKRQIKAGKIPGRHIGHKWYMTDADIKAAVESFAPSIKTVPAVEPNRFTPSERSMRRRIAC